MRIEVPTGDSVLGVKADNPSPLTLEGTNTWLVGEGEVWVVDPGPELPEHVAAVAAEVTDRGRLAGVALTHGHADHSAAVPLLLEALGPAPVIAGHPGHGPGEEAGPLEVLSLPGHSRDHLAFAFGDVIFTGDAIFANSSVFISPGPGSLAGYLNALQDMSDRSPAVLAPGHGPLITDPSARIAEQVAHRLERERRLVAAIADGHYTVDAILGQVWDDVPEMLLPAATVTLAAHLDKLADEERLPDGVERPDIPEWVV